ncbi:MAG TPA: LysM domain-containing protein [Candidatus Binatia bacterium]|nr:LysM domain-containing protein [Candidatus Binatia bacterium]
MLRRADLPRYLAPAAFLALVTIAVLLVRSGLHHSGAKPVTTTTAPTHTQPRATRATTTRATTTTAAAGQFYTVQSGDTYSVIASRFGTTVTQLEALNPGVSSNALRIGQRIRVK